MSTEETLTLLKKFESYQDFLAVLLDAYVLIDQTGLVIKANSTFAQLVSLKSKQIQKKKTLDEILQLSVGDKPLSASDILKFSSVNRIDEVMGKVANNDSNKNLIIGSYPFLDKDGAVIGSFIILRDVTAETDLQDQYKDKAMKSITDALTGLFTRAYFEEYLSAQVERMKYKPQKDRQDITLVICDIDHFKKVNDTYGHQAGDHVLKVVARLMQKTFRKTDICCRYGGEEFLVILPAAAFDNAAKAANKFRLAVAGQNIVYDDRKIPITASCGVATIMVDTEELSSTISRADQALYKAKEWGRNRVCVHDGSEIRQSDEADDAA